MCNFGNYNQLDRFYIVYVQLRHFKQPNVLLYIGTIKQFGSMTFSLASI